MNVALITDQEHASLMPSDRLLIPAFKKQGIAALPAVWDDPTIDWTRFDFLVLRSCWNYYEDIERFKSWLAKVESQGPQVINPSSLVGWNLDKKYLFDLQAKGLRIPDTKLIPRGDSHTLGEILEGVAASIIVVKPRYGASAHGVLKIEKTTAQAYETQYRSLVSKTDMLVQTFIPEISEGEYSAVFIGGELSHVILKKPKYGEFRSNGGLGGTEKLVILGQEIEAKVTDAFSECHIHALFARLDFVIVSSSPMFMELELVEPYLFFEIKEHAAELFVSKFKQFIKV